MNQAFRDEDAPSDASEKGTRVGHIPTDCAGLNFFDIDAGLRAALPRYLGDTHFSRLEGEFRRMGELAGGRLDELARIADRHGPILHSRDRHGVDEDWIEYHPAYREMEAVAFQDFQLHAMSHRGGMFGSNGPLPYVAKYAFQYLFVQAEFGLMCPISVSDTSAHLVRKFGSEELKARLLPRMLSSDPALHWKGTQFMTEKAGGSDVGAIKSVARCVDGQWRVTGEKWFCSHADADVALILARPEGAPAGTKGLALFALPRRLDNGARNSYRIVRLKDKLGTRSMASGEIKLDDALVYLVGDARNGIKQMMEQVNLSRLSHGVRAAAMMRRCLNEALAAARARTAFGRRVVDFPLMRRQLMKLMVPAEMALSMTLYVARMMDEAAAGADGADELVRILTPMFKFRACRDNITVATGAMEAKGGAGYVEEWVNARLVRDAHIGVLWEGTSNINALDIVQRAVGKVGAHKALQAALHGKLDEASALPPAFVGRMRQAVDRATSFAEAVARSADSESEARTAASALYNATGAVLLAWEGAVLPGAGARALLSRMVLDHKLSPRDPLAPREAAWEVEAAGLILSGVSLAPPEVTALLTA